MATFLARKKKFQGEKFLKFRCTDCGNCCTDTIVPVTSQDITRLQKGLKLPAQELAEFYKASEFDDEGEGLHFVRLDIGARVMGLRKRFDEKEERESCKFFKDNRCTVYEHRPVTCRVWPFTLSFDDTGKRITRLEINDALPCPFELDGANDPKKVAADWKWDDKQDDVYSTQIKAWNKEHAGGTAEDFFKFLGLETA
jgi:Fe-S-cluster containining protein